MKFKIIYEYFEIVDADSLSVENDTICFDSHDDVTHWVPKYMIKTIIPLDKEYNFDDDDGKDN